MALGQSLPFQARQLLYEHLQLVQLELATSREAFRVIEIDDDATGEQGNRAANGHGGSWPEAAGGCRGARRAPPGELGEQARAVPAVAGPLPAPTRLRPP